MIERTKDWVAGIIAGAMAAILAVGFVVLFLVTLVVIGELSAALLRAIGIY